MSRKWCEAEDKADEACINVSKEGATWHTRACVRNTLSQRKRVCDQVSEPEHSFRAVSEKYHTSQPV
jgi:hypothetical protein